MNTVHQNWIVSYDDVPEIRSMYSQYRNIPYQLTYSAARHYKGNEIMYFSNNIQIPDIENPSTVKAFNVTV